MLLISFGSLIGRWRTTLTVAWGGMMVWGSLMALVTPYNRGLMIALTFLQQTFFGWAQYESVMFTQLGVSQYDLGTLRIFIIFDAFSNQKQEYPEDWLARQDSQEDQLL